MFGHHVVCYRLGICEYVCHLIEAFFGSGQCGFRALWLWLGLGGRWDGNCDFLSASVSSGAEGQRVISREFCKVSWYEGNASVISEALSTWNANEFKVL